MLCQSIWVDTHRKFSQWPWNTFICRTSVLRVVIVSLNMIHLIKYPQNIKHIKYETAAQRQSQQQIMCEVHFNEVSWFAGSVESSRLADGPGMEQPYKNICLNFMTLLATLICRHRLSWFGKVKRPSCEISRVRSMSIDAKNGFGRPRKTWSWCICISEYLKLLSSLNCMMPRTDWDGDHMWRIVNWSLS